jgi:soluble lytic murein transglycosylase-like protein
MKRAPYHPLLLVLLGICGQIDSAAANLAVPVGYVRAANAHHITPEYAYLAALSRSGVKLDNGCLQPWPWTLTVGAVTTHYPTRAEAHRALLASLSQDNATVKVGLMQVDAQNADPRRLNDLLEPAANLLLGLGLQSSTDTAVRALRQRYRRFGLAGFCQPRGKFAPVRFKASTNRLRHRQIADLVRQLAGQFQVDPALVMAVIHQESGFNTAALSAKKAQGLMQLMPQTALRFGVRHPFDPEDNIRGGIAYLHWLLRHFGGNVALVLAGYNAGENAVDRYRGIPPYPETRHYVRCIMANYPNAQHPIPPPVSS